MADLEGSIIELLTERPTSDLVRKYLGYIKHIKKYEPNVIYDIGACIGAFSKLCHLIFPDAKVILFDADDSNEKRYTGEDYHIVCLSDTEGYRKFYNKSKIPELHSYYKSKYLEDDYKILETTTLTKIVHNKQFRYPDIVKINCCGAELDILKGGSSVIMKAKYLIVSVQNKEIFEKAPLVSEVGPYIVEQLGFTLEEIFDPYGTGLFEYVFINKNI
jgi:hypothetical protein